VVTKQRNFEMEWAKIHLDTLNARLSALLRQPENLYRITTNEDLERQLLTIKGESIGSLEVLTIGLIAGDFVCNLRGALDHLAWALSKIGKSNPSSETCFPIFGEDNPRTQAKIAAAVAGMPSGAVAAVKSFQPYNSGKSYKSHHLWRLNFLWNANKHRIIGLHSINSGTLFEVARGIPILEERKFQDHGIVTIPLSAKDKVRLNPRPNTEIFFGDEERGVQLTIQDLRDIYEFVRLEVNPALSCFLP
jgi:hypothetical protein